MTELRPTTDGIVTIRSPRVDDAATLIAGRDDEFHRFLAFGDTDPQPVGVIEVDDTVIGWVDSETHQSWLLPGEVNIGYNVFAAHRGSGNATRAVQLLIHHLAVTGDADTATLLIDADNARSLALANRIGCIRQPDFDLNPYFKRPIPPLSYTDGVITIRPRAERDLGADIESQDDEQIDWLWQPGERETWESLTPELQRAHVLQSLQTTIAAFGAGPKWTFTVDTADDEAVAIIDCNLANEDVPRGQANIAYATHPIHRGRGHVTRSVRLIEQFLRDHTGCREAYLVIDQRNTNSLRVAHSLGALPDKRWTDNLGHTFIRHVIPIDRS
ncbi:MAG: GNAT family N-acetyltransferase [Ilumatobacteraceae bacterium]